MNRLWVRLSLVFVTVIIVGVVLLNITTFALVRDQSVVPFIRSQLSVPDGFVAQLGNFYGRRDSWRGIGLLMAGMNGLLPQVGDNTAIFMLLADAEGSIIFDPSSESVGTPLSSQERAEAEAIVVDGEVVGYITLRFQEVPIRLENLPPISINGLTQLLLVAITIVGLLSILIGIIASRWLTQPLNELQQAVQHFGKDNLTQRVTIKGTTEVQAVANAFNQVADELELADTQQRNLLADIAHELRTPLSVLRANLQAMLDGIYTLSLEEVETLRHQTDILQKLVEDLHQLAQAEAHQLVLNFETFDLNEMIQTILKQFRGLLEQKHIQLVSHLPESSVMIEGDSVRLTQVIHNLVQNAFHYTPENGTITVMLKAEEEEAILTIEDNGIGIPYDELETIFERFYRTDKSRTRSTGGVGLGLAIAKAFVNLHGGEIRAMKRANQQLGTTFEVRLSQIRLQDV